MFRTLDDLNKKGDDKKKKKSNEEEKKEVDWYAGGTSSGMAVESKGDVDKIVDKAKKNSESGESLGDRDVQLKITLYENGFQVDDEEFRDYEGDKNK